MLLVAVVPAVVVVVAVAIAAFVCKGHAMTSASACCLGPLLSAGSWIALGAVTVGSLAPAKHRTSDQSLWNLVTKDAFLAACAAWALLSGMT